MKKLSFTLLLLAASLFATAQSIEQVYHFGQPSIRQTGDYQTLSFEGSVANGTVGEPLLPWQSVSLMLPQNTEATAIRVTLSDFVELDGQYQLLPAQAMRPISDDSPFVFEKNEALYRSDEAYPNKAFNSVNTQLLNGVSFAFGGFTPVKYKPASGKVSYAQTVTVTVDYQTSRSDNSKKLWLRPETRNSLSRLAQNAEMLSTYTRRDGALPTYETLIVTTEQYANSFEEYIALYAGQGLRVRVVTTQDIYSQMDGRDNPEKIRNYIIQEYENNGISMVLIGGDVDVVPHRNLWCNAQPGYEDQVPSDTYYACLDGTLNDDGDNKWGEIGEDDLLPELSIARLPFNNANQLQTILSKAFSYTTSPVLGEFRKPILGGEHLGDGVYASTDLERLVGECSFNGYTTYGYPEDYDFVRIYETPTHAWDAAELAQAINSGCQYVNHFGHANTSYVSGWYNWDITPSLFAGANGVDHNYFVFKSQGCICGDFADDCILERMVVNETGAVAAIGNTRYGWYSQTGDGPSNHYHRELIDAYNHERMARLGDALKESKIQTAPFITMDGEIGVLRWTFYALNALGDVALSSWFDEPFTPETDCATTLPVGTNRIPVTVKDENGNGVYNFECRLFKGDELIALASTDENGEAELRFAAVNNTDVLDLYIVGMNGWPQHLELGFNDDNCAHVLIDSYTLNDPDGQVDFNESQSLNVVFRNVGNLEANDIDAWLYCGVPEYLTLVESETTIDHIDAYGSVSLDNAFTVKVSDNVPNQTVIPVVLYCRSGCDMWESHFDITVNAPNYGPIAAELEELEGDGNGHANYGETLTLHFTGKNTGHSLSPNTQFAVFCSAPEIVFDENIFSVGDLAPEESFNVDFTFSIVDPARSATAYELILATYSGQYVVMDSYFVNVDSEAEDFETGDFTKYDWQMSGEGGWEIISNDVYEGSYCAHTTPMDHSCMAVMSLDYEFVTDNEISFMVKTSTETGYDFLVFYVDDERMGRWSGETGWTKASYMVPQGIHTLTWSYEKDGGATGGQDCVWVDYIVLPPMEVVLDVDENGPSTPSTGSGTEGSGTFTVFPNPTNGVLFVETFPETSPNEIIASSETFQETSLPGETYRITNLMGQTLMAGQITAEKQQIDVSVLHKGMYFITVAGKTQRFVVK
ncbi:MAG: T9SS type A sorting domain-containing protein [Bacteroidales bacterium]|nr:T9SS type A sorting domain-containing protein [Bacteroidales bacterium]